MFACYSSSWKELKVSLANPIIEYFIVDFSEELNSLTQFLNALYVEPESLTEEIEYEGTDVLL